MQIGSLFYLIWALWGILPVTLDNSEISKIIVWTTMIISSAMLGFGASILWVGQGKYIADWSGFDNNWYYTGLFFSIFMISQIIGNLISAFILYLFSQIIFFIIMSCFTLFGVLSFLFLKSPIHKLKHKEIANINENKTKDSIQLINSKDKMFDEDLKKIKTDESNFYSTIVLFFTIKMMKVNSLIIVWGIVFATTLNYYLVCYYCYGYMIKNLTNNLKFCSLLVQIKTKYFSFFKFLSSINFVFF